MSKSSVVGQIGGFLKDPFNMIPNPGNPTAPPAAPTPQAATMTALQNQFNQEVRMRGANTLQTGGEGLDEEPTSAGKMLLGGN